MSLTIPIDLLDKYRALARNFEHPQDLEVLDNDELVSLLMHTDEVVTVTPLKPMIELEGIISPYWVYSKDAIPQYQRVTHGGYFGAHPLELVWLAALPTMTVFELRYFTADGCRSLRIIRR